MDSQAQRISDAREHAEWVRDRLTAAEMDGISAVNQNERLLEVLGDADDLLAWRDATLPVIAALAIYGEDANLTALVEKARALNAHKVEEPTPV